MKFYIKYIIILLIMEKIYIDISKKMCNSLKIPLNVF